MSRRNKENSTSALFHTKSSLNSICDNVFKINKTEELSNKNEAHSNSNQGNNLSNSPIGYLNYHNISIKVNDELNSCTRIINQVYHDIRENQSILENLLNLSFNIAKKFN